MKTSNESIRKRSINLISQNKIKPWVILHGDEKADRRKKEKLLTMFKYINRRKLTTIIKQ